jgi:hypothetical protein
MTGIDPKYSIGIDEMDAQHARPSRMLPRSALPRPFMTLASVMSGMYWPPATKKAERGPLPLPRKRVRGKLPAMSARFARFLLLFTALWLPVQTMAALSMPRCQHAQEQAAASLVAEHGAMPCHEAAAQDQAPNHDAGCDNCEMCHIASTGFMPSTALTTGLVSAGIHYAMPAVAAPASHIAEPPQHPPRATV